MGPTFQALRDLHEIELQIVDIRQQLSRKQNAIDYHDKRLAALRRTLQEQRQVLLITQKEADALDLDLKARGAQVARLRSQLNAARTNKEYAAVLQELNTQKADESRIEAGTLEKLERVEKQRALCNETEAQVAQAAADLAAAREQHERTAASLSGRLARLTEQRERALERLPAQVAQLFERASERYEGEAMARIVRPNPRRDEFLCEGCNMGVNLERYNAIMTRDEVQTCPSCGRILYVDHPA